MRHLTIALFLVLSACSGAPETDDGVDGGAQTDAAQPDAGSEDGGDAAAESDSSGPDMPAGDCTPAHEANLPAPGGPFCVGVSHHVLTDESRPDPFERTAQREVVVHAWYPTRTAEGEAYLPMDAHSWERFELAGEPADIVANAIVDAPVADDVGAMPVFVFMPGLSFSAGLYTTYFELMASRGWLVLAVEHPGVSTTRFPDGTELGNELFINPGLFADSNMQTLVDDANFVVDEVTASGIGVVGSDRIDGSRLSYAGHSLGGATAVAVCEFDARCFGSLDFDGTFLNGARVDETQTPIYDRLTKPWGLVLSQGRYHGQETPFDTTIREVWDASTAPRFYAELDGARHTSLSDLLWFYDILEQQRGEPFGEPRATIDTQALHDFTASLLVTFLEQNADVSAVHNAVGALPFVGMDVAQ